MNMRTDSPGIRAVAKVERDRALTALDGESHSGTTEAYLAWSEARHQVWQAYAKAVLDIADMEPQP